MARFESLQEAPHPLSAAIQKAFKNENVEYTPAAKARVHAGLHKQQATKVLAQTYLQWLACLQRVHTCRKRQPCFHLK
jgi:hypothetical protein